ncbi:hypothetical protein [Kriegella aquimaris]|uniref:hypothetical protein n=1 Tax=Kriegella aquimaris TaxID=192904 RepID=UPI001FE050BB|nr:hypothetical protein [Kriegella aquimaris]
MKPFKIYNQVLVEFKRAQTGYATIAIIGQSCIGSVAAMTLLMSDIQTPIMLILLFLVTILCMAFNGAVLAQLKSKAVFNLLILSVSFSILVIIANLL